MDVRLTDEQQMLQAVATTIAADLAPSGINDLEADARLDRDRTRWSTLVDADLVALHVPALLGGSGAHVIDAALVAEQLAGSLVPVPFVGSAVWVPALLATAGATAAVEATAAGHLRLAPVLRPDLCGLAIQGDPGVAFDPQGA
ncbi:MAG TPA: acyl-CoA dehydrogenase family protein, partial [Acidimicrobiales bacterium]|nr:acyl-CoA dehydrogenase family protein [Acidimicrobiales bacterium]